MNNVARLGMAAAVLVAGCAMLEREGGVSPMSNPVPCTHGSSGICVITVTVVDCNNISASPDRALVAANDSGDIVWKVPGRWKFEGQGIVFRNPHSDFSNPRGGGSGEFRWANAHRVANREHKYTIHVTDGTQHCSHDPSIMN